MFYTGIFNHCHLNLFNTILIYLLLLFGHSKAVHMFSTGEGLLTQKDTVTSDGLQQVFATNLFGHFLLVSRLTARYFTQVQF